MTTHDELDMQPEHLSHLFSQHGWRVDNVFAFIAADGKALAVSPLCDFTLPK